MEQTSFTYDRELEVNGGQILIGRWLRGDRTLAQSLISSFDQGEIVWCDQTLRGEVTGH